MNWDQLPPRQIEECRHRQVTESGPGDGSAVCNLLAQAGLPRESCRVRRDTCAACLSEFPPAPDCWNSVVVSSIFARSNQALESASLAPQERAKLVQLRDKASVQLPVCASAIPAREPPPDRKPLASSLWELLPPPKPHGQPRVRTWAVGVLSSPRRQPTLDTTLDSLSQAGWKVPCLFLDGMVRVAERFAHLPGVLREPRIGCWPNTYLALAELLMRHPDADAYFLAQDDIRCYDAEVLRDYLEQLLWPERRPCLVSLYCPSIYTAPVFGWRALPVRWALGALAFIFPRTVAQDFLLDRSVCDYRWKGWQQGNRGLANTDVLIGRWAWRKRIPIWYPTPSLVQHIGITSTLTPHYQLTGERLANRWAGSLISLSGG